MHGIAVIWKENSERKCRIYCRVDRLNRKKMEFRFDINQLFEETVAVVDHRMDPCRSTGANLKSNLEKVIDAMGQASAQAQDLHGPITSAHKLRFSKHHLYVMKDASANGGLGAVVGILKVGRKKLFVLDHHGNQTEMEPLCVLDFYVHESCQRRGCGKQLFEGMLAHEGIKAEHLPIDRPSHKFTSFLKKHYTLRATIHQVNNFVIFDGFFQGQPEGSFVRKRSSTLGDRKPPIPPNNRVPHYGYRNASNAALWSHNVITTRRNSMDNPTTTQAQITKDVLPGIGRSGSASSISSHGAKNGSLLPGTSDAKDVTSRAYRAQATNYSRHVLISGTPPLPSGSASKTRSSPIAANTEAANGTPAGTREATPPFGRPKTFGSNSHLSSQTRDGHLRLSPLGTSTVPGGNLGTSPVLPNIGATTPQKNTTPETPPKHTNHGYSPGKLTREGNYCVSAPTTTMHSSWNIMGIPPSYQQGQGTGEAHGSSNSPW